MKMTLTNFSLNFPTTGARAASLCRHLDRTLLGLSIVSLGLTFLHHDNEKFDDAKTAAYEPLNESSASRAKWEKTISSWVSSQLRSVSICKFSKQF
ncbi:hypothetical protein EVAR_72590_1 [Eumeta japonica]|uniref:Uncharacterized protein n=1 Tax=Eumeta variegata TaxID=151549 RepID=A0A4C1SCX5_EUMVA|nr:hypothetical protein EVAR_72590_1 [Eumeta japonica]